MKDPAISHIYPQGGSTDDVLHEGEIRSYFLQKLLNENLVVERKVCRKRSLTFKEDQELFIHGLNMDLIFMVNVK